MTALIQALESRTFFSVTAANLAADKTTLLADAAVVKADLNTLFSDSTTASKTIAADFKGLPKADQPLLKTLITNENKAKGLFLKEDSALAGPADTLAGKAISLGDSLLTKATAKTLATVSKDILSLGSILAVPLATLQAQLDGTLVSGARAAILAALPTDTTLDTDVSNAQTVTAADKVAIGTAALQFETDLLALVTDLTSVHAATGTFPNAAGVFTGSAHETSGTHKGKTAAVTLTITSEDSNGNLGGTVTDFSGEVDPLVGTITLNGVVTLKSTPGTGTVKIAGVLAGNTLGGAFGFSDGRGTYVITRTTG